MPCFISDLTRTVKPPETLLVHLFLGLIRLTAEKLGRLILSSKGQCVANKHIYYIFITNIVDKCCIIVFVVPLHLITINVPTCYMQCLFKNHNIHVMHTCTC